MKANIYEESHITCEPQLNGAGKSTSPKSKPAAKAGSAKWLIAGLLLLSAIPLTAGTYRLIELSGGANVEITPANARFFASPVPVVLHIGGAFFFALLGPFQLATRFRGRWPGWHRRVGRFLVGCGLVVGLSGVWMTLFYPVPAGSGGGLLLFAFRLVFGSAMVAAIVAGFAAIRQGDVARHRAWMLRAYAIGMGAGTQVLTQMVGEMVAGKPDEVGRALLIGAGWVINLAVAEWAIRRNRSRNRKRLTLPNRTAV